MVVGLNGSHFKETFFVKRALESFYGIGPKISERLMARHFIHPTAKMGALNDSQVDNLTADMTEMTIENDLKRTLLANIQRLRDMGTYRGRRHAMNLPVRGQRTRTQIGTARRLNRMERRG